MRRETADRLWRWGFEMAGEGAGVIADIRHSLLPAELPYFDQGLEAGNVARQADE